MSRIKGLAVALMTVGALLNLAPVAAATETETMDHCLPFIDHPVVCFVVCTAEKLSVKDCGLQAACAPNPSLFCGVFGEVWSIVP